ncbi:MAG: ATPase [Bacteroidetes bacterium]|nr:MAG: ATPase [Bacteroidota bacterium]
MNSAILFNFQVDKENKKIKVERSFNAQLPIIWQAWTDAKILDQWWGPKPWKAKTVNMDFREGGQWFYAMVGPDDAQSVWCLVDYKTIVHQKSFAADSSFANENKEINRSMAGSHWETEFISQAEETLVKIYLTFDKLEDLEQYVQMGFKEGFTIGLEQLDEWLNQQKP